MIKLMLICLALAVPATAYSVDRESDQRQYRQATQEPSRIVDLRTPQALEELQRTRPEHYEKISRAIEALRAEPKLAEGDWLQINVNARDVDLSRLLIRTSYPPKQVLGFTIDDTRYLMHVVRSDMVAEVQPAK